MRGRVAAILAMMTMPALASDLRDAPPLLQADALVAHLHRCLYVPIGTPDESVLTRVRITIGDGALSGVPMALTTPETADEARLVRMVVRAAASCAPYPEWMNIGVELTVTATPPGEVAVTPRHATRLD